MSTTETIKTYSETAVNQGRQAASSVAEQGRTGLLVAIGAGDVVLDRARTVVTTFRSRAEALPGELQVQADLASKEARTRAEQAAAAVRPEALTETVSGLVETARRQALSTIEELAERGEKVVGDLRRQPAFRRVVRRAEEAVDSVEDALEDVLEETSEAVAEASDTVTSVAQKTKARAEKAIDEVEDEVSAAADAAKATVHDAAEADVTPAPAAKAPRKATRARTATPPKATAVPAKSTPAG